MRERERESGEGEEGEREGGKEKENSPTLRGSVSPSPRLTKADGGSRWTNTFLSGDLLDA